MDEYVKATVIGVRLIDEVSLVASGAMGFDLSDSLDCHVYLVRGAATTALIDAGAGRDTSTVLERVVDAGVDPTTIRYVLLTHGHADHAGGAAALREHLPHAEVRAAAPVPDWLATADDAALSVDRGRASGVYPAQYRVRPCRDVRCVRDGAVFDLGGVRLTALAAPGHCAGHTCYLMHGPSGSALFSGDCVFTQGRVSIQNLHDVDIPEYAKTVARLSALDCDMLFPGHHEVSLARAHRHIAAAHEQFNAGVLPRSVV